MPDAISVGLIGAGVHGTRYARHIQADVDGLHLVGLVRRTTAEAKRIAQALGVTAFESVQALLAAVDAVVIVTPPPSHAALIGAALDAGRYVLVEKPVTATEREVRPLLERDAAAGGRVMVAHTLRYDPVVRGVKDRLGDVAPVHYLRLSQRLNPSTLAWQRSLRESGGGSILLTGVHLFDTAAWLLGETLDITHCVRERVLNPATEDFFLAVGRTRSGVHVSMEVSKFTTHRACFIEVVGEQGQLLGDYQTHELSVGSATDRALVPGIAPAPTVREVLRDFERWMRGHIPNPIPLADGARAVALADRCLERAGG